MKAALLLFLAIAPAALAVDVLVDPHVDLSINFRGSLIGTGTNPWRLTARDEDGKQEYGGQREGFADPLTVILHVPASAQFEVPDDPAYNFLGPAGAPIWVLPQVQEPGLLFLGFSTENKTSQSNWVAHNVSPDHLVRGIAPGTFLNNQITLRLESFSGPGDFSVFTTDSFGMPVIAFRTDDGLSSADSRTFTPSNHVHFNWSFSEPGTYIIGLRASGTLAGGGDVSSSDITYFRFDVIPEPGTGALLAVVAGLFFARRRRR